MISNRRISYPFLFAYKLSKIKSTLFCDCLQVGFYAPDIKRGQLKSWIVSRDIELRYEESELYLEHIFYDLCFLHFQTFPYHQTWMRMTQNSAWNDLGAWNTFQNYILKRWSSCHCLFDLCLCHILFDSWYDSRGIPVIVRNVICFYCCWVLMTLRYA